MYLMEALALFSNNWQEKLSAGEDKKFLEMSIHPIGGDMHRWIMQNLTPVQIAELIMGNLEEIGMTEIAADRVAEFSTAGELLDCFEFHDFLADLFIGRSGNVQDDQPNCHDEVA